MEGTRSAARVIQLVWSPTSRAGLGQFVAEEILTAVHEAVADDLDVLVGGDEHVMCLSVFLAEGVGEFVGFFGGHNAVKWIHTTVLCPVLFDLAVDTGSGSK